MVTVPGFLLRRLYVKKSLRNTDSGFAFELLNRLGSGYSHGMHPVVLDGQELAAESTSFVLDGQETAFADVSEENTFTLPMNRSITVKVDGESLGPGPHKIGMGFEVPGLGALKFDFTDEAADG